MLIGGFIARWARGLFADRPGGSPPNGSGFSFSKLLEEVRREIRGNPASAEATTTTLAPVKPGMHRAARSKPRTHR